MFYIEENKAKNSQKQDFSFKGEKEIMKRYEWADIFERLHIFLQHRDLRDDFMEIEMNNYKKRSIA
jgi:hypothetical protein